jgi:hypothetical protein
MDLEVRGTSFTLTFILQALLLCLVLSSVCGSRQFALWIVEFFTRQLKQTFTYIIDTIYFLGLSILCRIFFKYVLISL